MTARRLAFGLLAAAGVAVGHVLGYAAAHPDAAARHAALGGHDYLPLAAAAIVPLAIISGLWWAVRSARSIDLRGSLRWAPLAATQIALFLFQEVGERVVDGVPAASTAAEPGVWLGLVAQLLVAAVLVRAVSWTGRLVRAVTARLPRITWAPAVVRRSPTRTLAPRPPVRAALRLRGPPVVV